MKRKPDESFEDYRARRKLDNDITKIKLSGKTIYDPRKFVVGVDNSVTQYKGKSYAKPSKQSSESAL